MNSSALMRCAGLVARSKLLPVALALLAAVDGAALAQSAPPAGTTQVTAGSQYGAGWFHRWLFGNHYRDLWTTPVEVEVLDLRTFAGGLKPLSSGGARQTRSLWLEGKDGRQYALRSVEKYPSAVLPPDLRGTVAQRVIEDQTSAGHPSAPLVVGSIARAVGVPQGEPRMVVVPDDPLLGEFRAEFAGMLGIIEERPVGSASGGPGFAGASRIINTADFFGLLDQGAGARPDERAFLSARLLDVFLGDWDRHRGQWRWGQLSPEGNRPWLPIPEDRDQAFARYDGLLLYVARQAAPQLVKFGRDFPSMVGLTWNGREVDRRLLTGLEQSVWDSTAARLRGLLTDSLIDAAAARLPAAHFRLNGAALTSSLKQRRDRLGEAATSFYRMLAGQVDVHGTDQPERVEVNRVDDRFVEVRGFASDGSAWYQRLFDRRDTREVRLLLKGGDDRVIVRGEGRAPMTIRVIGGGGSDLVLDSSAVGGTRVYDTDRGTVASGRDVALDRRSHVPTVDPEMPWWLPRDWGSLSRPMPWLSYGPDLGVFVGAGLAHYRYGFRNEPYASRVSARVGYATTARTGRVELDGDFRRSNSRVGAGVRARASGLDILYFHGFGNDSPRPGTRRFHRVRQEQLSFEADVRLPLGPRGTLSFGPVARYAHTDPEPGSLLAGIPSPVYGNGAFGQLGAQGGILLDFRDRPVAASRGAMLSVSGSVFPEVWDVRQGAFGEVHGEASAYATATMPLRPTLALRAGGKKVWGTYPFHEAAFLGGGFTVRGFRSQRFAGDAAVFGNAELRLRLTRFFFLLPGDFGIFGLADGGRVYLRGETSDTWHGALGGGLWFAFLNPANTVSVALASSEEQVAVYARAGFHF